ncbi:MAG: hypothetical protein J6B16_00905 [Clostridia bacterium]|nr:hypothetical protein [Clostridia bacterium]
MQITYKNDKKDYRDLYIYNALFGKKKKFINIAVYIGICVFSFIAMVVFLILSMPKPATLLLYLGILFVVVSILSICGVVVAVKKAMTNLDKTAVDFYFITTTYDFREDGYTVTSKNSKKRKPTITNLDYSTIIKGVERKSVIYLYVHPTVAFILKKTDIDNLDDFLTLLKKQLGDKLKCLQKM